jgi:hypothetical protein
MKAIEAEPGIPSVSFVHGFPGAIRPTPYRMYW